MQNLVPATRAELVIGGRYLCSILNDKCDVILHVVVLKIEDKITVHSCRNVVLEVDDDCLYNVPVVNLDCVDKNNRLITIYYSPDFDERLSFFSDEGGVGINNYIIE